MINKIEQLPRLSAPFTAHLEKATLTKKEWMPCPRCGEAKVEPPHGVGVGVAAGVSLMGCGVVVGGLITTVAFVVFPSLGIGLGIGFAIAILSAPFLGAKLGGAYKCKSCRFAWDFKEALAYQDENFEDDGQP